MSINVNEKNTIKKFSKEQHQYVIYEYIVTGKSQQQISESMGITDPRSISCIVRAYNFNREKTAEYESGKDRGRYKQSDREFIIKFINLHYPGIVDDNSILFNDYLMKYKNRTPLPRNVPPRTTVSTTSNTRRPSQSFPNPTSSRTSQASSQVSSRTSQAPSQVSNRTSQAPQYRQQSANNDPMIAFLRKYLLAIVLGCVVLYYGYTGLIKPAFEAATYKVSTFSQKDVIVTNITSESGKYTGEVKKKKANGLGKVEYNNGDIFVGQLSKDKREQYGITVFNNTDKYIGGFDNDQYDGFGLLEGEEGDYIGNFKDGKRHGIGAVMTDDLMISVSNYKKGKIVGEIALINYSNKTVEMLDGNSEYKQVPKDDNSFFVGKYKGEKLEGFTIEVATEYLYFGNFKNNKEKGYGVKINENGQIQFGDRQNKEVNHAILYLPEGDVTLGTFKDGEKTGYGMEYMTAGDLFFGYYKSGQRHGKCTYVFPGGIMQACKYNKGQLIEG